MNSTSLRPPVPGWVYVMESLAYSGAVKVGCTTRTPAERAVELSRGSGVPVPLEVLHDRPVSDCKAVERATHRMLADVRVSKDREWFHCTAARAIGVIDAVADSYPVARAAPRAAPPMLRPLGAAAAHAYPLHLAGERKRLRTWSRSRWRMSAGGMRISLVLSIAAVCVAVAVFKPDLSGLPAGAIARALLLLEHGRV